MALDDRSYLKNCRCGDINLSSFLMQRNPMNNSLSFCFNVCIWTYLHILNAYVKWANILRSWKQIAVQRYKSVLSYSMLHHEIFIPHAQFIIYGVRVPFSRDHTPCIQDKTCDIASKVYPINFSQVHPDLLLSIFDGLIQVAYSPYYALVEMVGQRANKVGRYAKLKPLLA